VANLLRAIQNIVNNPISDLLDSYQENNQISDKGILLEELIQDIFANTLAEENKGVRVSKHAQVFSYLGNQNNPPDLILRDGDAVEVKKIDSFTAGIRLNISYPRSKLLSDDPMIIPACRSVDGGNWNSKDLIYVIGVVKENKLKRLWLIIGDCLAADDEIYQRIRDKIIVETDEIRNAEFSKNKELEKINNLNPLERMTYLRISGAWGIANPVNIYNYLNIDYNENANLQVIAIMKTEKYRCFPQSDLDEIAKLATDNTNLKIRDVQINCPNNNVNLIEAKLIIYQN
jgi:NgoPII restriction endonuclease